MVFEQDESFEGMPLHKFNNSSLLEEAKKRYIQRKKMMHYLNPVKHTQLKKRNARYWASKLFYNSGLNEVPECWCEGKIWRKNKTLLWNINSGSSKSRKVLTSVQMVNSNLRYLIWIFIKLAHFFRLEIFDRIWARAYQRRKVKVCKS